MITIENRVYPVTEYGVVPDSERLQTDRIQRVLDLCRAGGGTVVFPAGTYHLGGVRMWSDTTLRLEAGARLMGSDRREDYVLFPVPSGVELRTDMQMIPDYYYHRPMPNYRRALISAYGERHVSIVGEAGSVIDGQDCFDEDGEEGFRGPHGIFFSNCDEVHLEGYTIQNCGNFHHQLDRCRHIRAEGITALAGHDGFHMHYCEDIRICRCTLHTGDDCIAGINMRDLQVTHCDLNTACNTLRIGGRHLLIEDCRIWGPGIYPHRYTIVRGREDILPPEQGRHNTFNVVEYFSSIPYPSEEPAGDIVLRRCTVENAESLLHYQYGSDVLHTGTPLQDITFEDVTATGLYCECRVRAKEDTPLRVVLKNVTYSFRENALADVLFDGSDPRTEVVICP